MNKNEIYIKTGTQYKEMTKALLTQCNLAAQISDTDMQIGIKPNLVSPSEASWGATTHPEIVAGIIEYLQENGYRKIAVLEGSWVGDKTTEAYEVCGYRELSERYQVPFWDMQKDKGIERDCGGVKLNICERVANVDFLINVPVLKGHCQTKSQRHPTQDRGVELAVSDAGLDGPEKEPGYLTARAWYRASTVCLPLWRDGTGRRGLPAAPVPHDGHHRKRGDRDPGGPLSSAAHFRLPGDAAGGSIVINGTMRPKIDTKNISSRNPLRCKEFREQIGRASCRERV